MGLYRRGKVWWMSFSYHGKGYKRSTKTEDRKLGQRIYDKVRGEIVENKWFEKPIGDSKTLREMFDRFLTDYCPSELCEKSIIRTRGIFNNICDWTPKGYDLKLGNWAVTHITSDIVAQYKAARNGKVKPRTVQYELQEWQHAYTVAIKEWRWLKENPVADVEKPSVKNFKELYLTEEMEDKLYENIIAWMRPIVKFAIHTGLRETEVIQLAWPQIDIFKKQFVIRDQKNDEDSTLPLDENAMEVIVAQYKVRHISCDRVFYNTLGHPIYRSNLIRGFKNAVAKIGLPQMRFHDLRHTFATRLIQRGTDVYTVQKLGRWKDIKMVMRYAHHNTNSLREGIKVLDQKPSKQWVQRDEMVQK